MIMMKIFLFLNDIDYIILVVILLRFYILRLKLKIVQPVL